jgi:integrase/recombinase XerC
VPSLPTPPDARELGDPAWPPRELAEFAVDRLDAGGDLSPSSAERLFGLIRRFGGFAERACDLRHAQEIGPEHAEAFVHARSESGSAPSVATMHLRRTALRLAFREARRHGILDADPTSAIALPPRSYKAFRPLTVDEIDLGRSFSRSSLRATREPAAWALSEAGARTSELPYIRIRDVDLALGVVVIAGGAKTAARRGSLTTWGIVQLRRRIAELDPDGPDASLVCKDTSNRTRARANAYASVRASLVRAGLGDEPDIRPNSVVAWRGASAMASGASIDQVALMLGIRSLDATAAFIGWNWAGEER